MIKIVVYGKPRSFESHEYVFGLNDVAASDNSFEEPLLKPVKDKELVLHYFVREGYAGLEYYHRANGYESNRDGLVFGIALKTDFDFEINKVVNNVLYKFWKDFARNLLDNEYRFISPSMLGDLIGTEWSDEEISIIKNSVKQIPFHKPNSGRKICLLVAPEIEQIYAVESQLKEYSDVYIAGNIDIFKDSANRVLLNENHANGIIYEIKNDKIMPIDDDSNKPSVLSDPEPPVWGITPIQGGGKEDPDRNNPDTKGPNGGGNNKPNDQKKNGGKMLEFLKKNRSAIVAFLGLCVFVVGVVVLLKNINDLKGGDSGNKPDVTGDGSGGEKVASGVGSPAPYEEVSVTFREYTGPIEDRLVLSPKVKGTTEKIDIKYDHSEIVSLVMSDNGPILVVNKNKRPSDNTTVTVMAYHNGTEVGRQSYTIAAKEPGDSAGSKKVEKKLVKNIVICPKYNTSTRILLQGDNATYEAKSGGQLVNGTWKVSGAGRIRGANGNLATVSNTSSVIIDFLQDGNCCIEFQYDGKTKASLNVPISKL